MPGIDENGHEAELKLQSKALKLKRITFIGEVHGNEKQQLYRDADLFVLPTHAENFGLVIAEALAQETPVITTRNAPWSGLEDQRCGWWIDLQQDRLTSALREALNMAPQDLSAMGKRGRMWICREFSMEKVASQMREVYLWATQNANKPSWVFI